MTDDELKERNVDLLPQGYYMVRGPDNEGSYVIKCTEARMAEKVATRKAYEADFDRRMNLPDPVYHRTTDTNWIPILAALGTSVILVLGSIL